MKKKENYRINDVFFLVQILFSLILFAAFSYQFEHFMSFAKGKYDLLSH